MKRPIDCVTVYKGALKRQRTINDICLATLEHWMGNPLTVGEQEELWARDQQTLPFTDQATDSEVKEEGSVDEAEVKEESEDEAKIKEESEDDYDWRK